MRLRVSGVVRRSFCLLVVWTCGTIRGGSVIISSPTPPSAAAAALNVLPPFRSPPCSPTRRRGRPKLEEPGHLAEGGSMNPKLRIHGDDAPSVDHMRGGRGVKLERTKLNGHDRDSSAQGDSTPHTSRPVGRPPLWAHGQAEDYGLPEFRAHSWGESAVGAIGQDSMENAEWDLNFQKLVEHYNTTRAVLPSDWEESPLYRRKGHAPPPKGTPLRAWVDTQRQLYRHGELDVRRQQRIQDVGLQLTLKGKLREVDWETMVGRLKSFYMLHGHCRVHEEEGEELLEQWVQVQQMKEMRGTLTHEKQALLKQLGMSWKSTWLESWKQLCFLKQRHGRVRIFEIKHDKRTLPLYMWLRNQRLMEIEGSLDKERCDLLDSLGCRWGGPGTEKGDKVALGTLGNSILDRYLVWEPRFNHLVLFKQMHGHCDLQSFLHPQPPAASTAQPPGDSITAADGCDLQHTQHSGGASGGGDGGGGHALGGGKGANPLTGKPIDAADAANILHGDTCGNWTKGGSPSRLGPGRPPKKPRENALQNPEQTSFGSNQNGRLQSEMPLVSLWLQDQKSRLEKNKLECSHKERLIALGALQEAASDAAASRTDSRNTQDGSWGAAAYDQGSKLERKHTEWLQRLEELRHFKRMTGHCSVPMKYPSNPGLARWVHTQRMRRRNGKMSAARARQLEKLGFIFEGRSQWEQRFLELVRFKERVGHCSPCQIGPNRRLGVWVAVQRVKYRKGQLKESRIKKLESIGFSWELHMDWDSRMQQLRVFKAKYGHCNVPQQIKMNGKGRVGTCSLGTWVTMQRMKRRSGRLSERQMQQLETVGFSWGLHAEWESRYQELLTFQQEHGHCNVPQKYSNNPSLGAWVAQQRRRFKHGTLSAKRIRLMEEAGVEWALRRGRHAHAAWRGGPSFAVADFKTERPDGNPSVGNVLNSNVLASVKIASSRPPSGRVEGRLPGRPPSKTFRPSRVQETEGRVLGRENAESQQ